MSPARFRCATSVGESDIVVDYPWEGCCLLLDICVVILKLFLANDVYV